MSISVAVFPLRPERTFGYAPPGRDGNKAKFAEGPAGRNTHYGREGGVGEFYICSTGIPARIAVATI